MENSIKRFNELYEKDKTNTILTGNGFNLNFGYNSSYENIFKKMKCLDDFYGTETFEKNMRDVNYDLEDILSKYKYLSKKAIKVDFIKALMEIMKDAENKKSQASDFIKKFDKVFTLNYDPFLYKVGIELTRKSNIGTGTQYGEDIRRLEEKFNNLVFPNGISFTNFNRREKATLLAACFEGKKIEFRKEAYFYFSMESSDGNDNWIMYDGFHEGKSKSFTWEKARGQNIFYLHGALHIYRERNENTVRKIAVKRMDTLRTQILSHIDAHSTLDCIFKNKEKLSDIKKNKYLNDCLEQLKNISGNIFLYGIGLGKNDNHVWSSIQNNSNIKNIYISVYSDDSDEFIKQTNNTFNSDNRITFFDSYLDK